MINSRRKRGYTLIEMVILTAVLGVAGMLLVPNLIDRSTFRIQAAARVIISDFAFAQSDALANQEFRRVQFLESPIGKEGYSGYCLTRIDPASFSYPFDLDYADLIEDPIAASRYNGRYLVDFENDSRFAGVKISDVQLDGSRDFTTFDEFGGSVSSAGGLPGTGGTIDLLAGESHYRVHIQPFTAKTTIEVLATP